MLVPGRKHPGHRGFCPGGTGSRFCSMPGEEKRGREGEEKKKREKEDGWDEGEWKIRIGG